MSIEKNDVEALIQRAMGYLDHEDSSYPLLVKYIKDAEEMIPDIKGKLTSAQKEVYDRLEVAVGP